VFGGGAVTGICNSPFFQSYSALFSWLYI